MNVLKGILNHLKEQKALPVLIILMVIASFSFDIFFTELNLKNIFRQVSMLGMVSIGMTLVMLTGGIDLSVGSVVAVCAILAAYLSEVSLALTIVIPIVVGLAVGTLNGFIITKMKITPFIATLATMLGVRGIAFVISDGEAVRPTDPHPAFTALARGTVFDIPYLGLLFLFAVGLFVVMLRYMSFGRRIYAIGGNEEAAHMMGLRVDRTKLMTYALSGLLSGIAGIMLASRLGAGQPKAAELWELQAIAATVVGGTLISGGVGTVTGTLYGVLILGVITNMVNQFGDLPYWYANLVTGLLLLVVILLQSAKFPRRAAATA